MTAHTKIGMHGKGRSGVFVHRSTRSDAFMVKVVKTSSGAVFIPAQAIDESLEDARPNAIADERANGPFVSVSLDDL